MLDTKLTTKGGAAAYKKYKACLGKPYIRVYYTFVSACVASG
jgi:hypothetical protein